MCIFTSIINIFFFFLQDLKINYSLVYNVRMLLTVNNQLNIYVKIFLFIFLIFLENYTIVKQVST